MAELPTGTVTFLFTDIEGSTRLWQTDEVAMRAALSRHDELLRKTVAEYDGVVFSSMGDGIAASFESAISAVAAALEAQRLLDAEVGPTGTPLRVRMGLHTGEAQLRDGDYLGTTVNRAARLMAIAHGGQVVVSGATEPLVRGRLPVDVALIDLGEHRLRDLSEPVRVFQIRHPDLLAAFPPLASLDAFPGNLPLQVTTFVGRQREIDRAIGALDAARVVTLTGVGGVGKTRLALQVAAEVLPRYRYGAWLCELAPVRSTEGVLEAVANVFEVSARSGQTLEQALVDFLRNKELLLLLDNCEHVLDEAADLAETLERSCSRLAVLATSREGLGIDGERILAVPSLGAPSADASPADVADADAVRLFVDRARALGTELEITTDNAEWVGQVCRRLDGVPLAIELAAARVPAMNPRELAARLDRRFQVLAGGRRGKIERHQTLRATIDWSYELLSEAEQRLLARMTVFSGGWTLEAAEHVCSGGVVDAEAVFELTERLVARSLVVAEDHGFQTRYRLLETIRQYGEERLAEHDETERLRAAHAEYFTEFAGVLTGQIQGPGQIEASRRFGAERENVLAAMQHAIDTDDVDLAFRLLSKSGVTTYQTGYALNLSADPILQLTGASEHRLYPFALAVAGAQAARRGERQSTETMLEQALAAAQRLGDPDRLVEQLIWWGRSALAYTNGQTLDAAIYAERTAEIARSSGWLDRLASSLASAATYHVMAGDSASAFPLATEGVAVARRVGMPTIIALNLTALAGALADQDPERAKLLLRESSQVRDSLGYESWGEITQALLIGARLGDWPHALILAPQCIRHLHWNEDWPLLGAIFNLVARALALTEAEAAAVLQGAAHRLVTAGITISTPPEPPVQAATADTTAPSAPSQTDYVTQARRTTSGLLRDTLGDARLHELRAEGTAMGNDQAVAYALDAIAKAQAQAAS